MQNPYAYTTGDVVLREGIDVPWKANGSVIDADASLDDWLDKAGLNYTVDAVPSLYQFGEELREVENRKQLIRSDTGTALAQVSASNYKVRQPREIMEFFRNLVESNNMQMDIIGQMQGGRKIFGLASTGDEAEIGKGSGDIVKANVFLIESFDLSHATKARSGVERLFCLNQIETNRFGSSNFVNKGSIKRKHSQEFIPEEVQFELAHVNDNFRQFVDFANAMTEIKMTEDMVKRFLFRLYAPKVFENPDNWRKAKIDYEREGVTTNALNVAGDVLNTLEDNLGHAIAGTTGTLWGALNAITFYHDHESRTKGEKRWESAMIGNGNTKKNEALQLALEVVNK